MVNRMLCFDLKTHLQALLQVEDRTSMAWGLESRVPLLDYRLIELLASVGSFFSTQTQLIEENERLRARALGLTHDAQRYEAAQAEAEQLRKLVGAQEKLEARVIPAEVLYNGRDPYSHKLFIDRGATHGVRPGSPVTDESGVVGQVTRVHPLLSEVTLATDRDQAIPVQVVRNGLRAVAFGGGASGTLELRFMAANADIQTNDRLITSGIDGTYPPGLPVASVLRIERDAENAFARVVCRPAAGVDRGRFVLVLTDDSVKPPRPVEMDTSKDKRRGRLKDRDKDGSFR